MSAFFGALIVPGMPLMPLPWLLGAALGTPAWIVVGWWALPADARHDFGTWRAFIQTNSAEDDWKACVAARKSAEEQARSKKSGERNPDKAPTGEPSPSPSPAP